MERYNTIIATKRHSSSATLPATNETAVPSCVSRGADGSESRSESEAFFGAQTGQSSLHLSSSSWSGSLIGRCGQSLTRTDAFRAAVERAFDTFDDSGDGIIDEAELYSGVLFVHLKVAAYAGPAACYPPTRAVCDRLFAGADRDGSGGIDRAEFVVIAQALCSQILSRMLVYYVILILAVPILGTAVVNLVRIPGGTYLDLVTREVVTYVAFFVAVPWLWNKIDARYSGGGGNGNDGTGVELTLRRRKQRQQLRQRKSVQIGNEGLP